MPVMMILVGTQCQSSETPPPSSEAAPVPPTSSPPDLASPTHPSASPATPAASPGLTPAVSPTEPAAEVVIYLIQLEGRASREAQGRFIEAMEQTLKRPVEVVYQYTTVFNGMAVKLTAKEAVKVAGMEGVRQVQPDTRRYSQDEGNGNR